MFEQNSVTLDDLDDVASSLAKMFKGGDIVLFSAEMGSGKTTLISKLAKALGVETQVTSPTFAIVESYPLNDPVNSIEQLIHIDTYRLTHVNELYDLGFETIFAENALTGIEWVDRIEAFIDKGHFVVSIDEVDEDTRNISVDFIEVYHD